MWHGQFMLLPLIKKPDFEADVMLARHSDAELMGAVLRHFDIKLIRGAGAAIARQGPGRFACLQGGGADVARGPHDRHDRRCSRRRGAQRRARRRHDRAADGPADPADGNRDVALHRIQQLEPHDGEPAVVRPRLCHRCSGRRAPHGRSGQPRSLSQGRRGFLECCHGAGLQARATPIPRVPRRAWH